MSTAAADALVVDVPSISSLLLAIPLTFDRSVLLRFCAAPANPLTAEWIDMCGCSSCMRLASPLDLSDALSIGASLLRTIRKRAMNSLHAATAGAPGELVLSVLGYMENQLKRRVACGESLVKDALPM
ncbi:hypothetical protein BD310DRAFT_803651 [Dichomitus squalens]|uniref:Uncharacterized protein n=1 Tax=Dichomitus squalens TaxID=114155 RepID=A0A4Q9QFM8_9APHY|nr:hypothetical protein BD310DRAFT_803651 [Dichomitus squalens]